MGTLNGSVCDIPMEEPAKDYVAPTGDVGTSKPCTAGTDEGCAAGDQHVIKFPLVSDDSISSDCTVLSGNTINECPAKQRSDLPAHTVPSMSGWPANLGE